VAWLRDVRKVGGETATGAMRTLSGLLAHATWEGLIPSNPVAVLPKGKRPKRQHEEHRYLSTEERDRLLEAMTATYRTCRLRGRVVRAAGERATWSDLGRP
jgi:hypothetical protein